MKTRPSVLYLLEDTTLFGGVKVVLRQADLLHRRGYDVFVASRGEIPDWYAPSAPFLANCRFDSSELPMTDLAVATYWTTIDAAIGLRRAQAVHYCQGFEAGYTHNHADHGAILEAYRFPLPAFVVAPHLGDLLRRRFGRPSRVVRQPLEPAFRPRSKDGPSTPPRILVVSPFEIDWKGVATALEAVKLLRRDRDCHLVRLSQWPLPAEERRILAADELHIHLLPTEVPDLVAGVDLLLAPSWEQEGFGLPVLEAMAAGVPVVASDVPCFRDFAAGAAELVPPRDPAALAAAAGAVLGDRDRWHRMREAGLGVAEEYAEERAAHSVGSALRWVADGGWREELTEPDLE